MIGGQGAAVPGAASRNGLPDSVMRMAARVEAGVPCAAIAAQDAAAMAAMAAARRVDLGGLDVSLPPPLGQLLRETARKLGDSPRLLALEILEAVLGGGLVDAVLDRG